MSNSRTEDEAAGEGSASREDSRGNDAWREGAAARKSVGVLLTRHPQAREAYLVERSPELRFMGGYLAFPGGGLDDQDERVEVKGLDRSSPPSPGSLGASHIAAAGRELFEETGVWMGRGGPIPPERLDEHRRRLLSGSGSLAEMMKSEGQHLQAEDFRLFCRLVTPPFSPLRFDTLFVRCLLPAGAVPRVWPGELVRGSFRQAGPTIRHWRRGQALIAPPVVQLLRELAESGGEGFVQRCLAISQAYGSGALNEAYFSPGVWLIPLRTFPDPPAAYTNAYLVGESSFYLVDPGAVEESERQRLWRLLQDLIERGRRFKGVLITHHHPDHVAAAVPCRERFGVALHCHPKTAKLLPDLKPEVLLEDGDSLDLGVAPDGSRNWRLTAFHLPGHAPDHLVFRESRFGAVLAGDLVSTVSSILVDPSQGRLSEYMHSLGRLQGLTSGFIYPGHGPPSHRGRAVVKRTIEHRKRREAQLVEALSEQPQSPQELLDRVYSDVPVQALEWARRSLISGLIHLVEQGVAVESGGEYARR